jgi:acyl dehydratase
VSGTTLYWEDFSPGCVTPVGERTLSREEIVAFAREWDPQYFHVDPEAARHGPFGGLTATGWQTFAVWSRMFVDTVLSRAASMGGPGMEDLRLLKPVRPGVRLRGELEILDTWPSSKREDRGTVFFEARLLDDDDEPVMRMRGRVYIRRRS